ncbi:SDR family oxidoreductase [Allostreptomyces psammosilenae]|uniref:dTDP-4-dehydrorhamnose reductase n=1 Tax=Allostreptomyces psammosilenae TaxID=1892865 RepID=A0A852ZZL0_9ACTN|nr:sugar nucleotide-binding protein [Allostreptomyces psammosilenae]NYI07589.1 dTDP-4-dehydrorhamnose reductase [Allostreptomyces psammosilenae]
MRVLLLGASGYVGGGLYRDLSARHDVVGTRAARCVPGLVRLDLRDEWGLRELAGQGFDLVVHAAGLVDLAAAEADPALAQALNVRSVEVLLSAVRGTGTKLLLLSSDNVFDGTREFYVEPDLRAPLNVYGRTKCAAEDVLLEAAGEHLVVRIPLVYGRSPFSDRFMARFAAPTTPAQVDVVCAPVYLPSLAPALERLWDASGVLHYGGAEVVTRFALMSRIRDALRLPTRVIPARAADAPATPRRPARLVLRSLHHGLLGPDLETALADMRRGERH